MNIIEELSIKYNGSYSEEQPKNVNSPIGKYIFQPKTGLIEIDGSKIGVNIDSDGGAIPVAKPFRITLYLNKNYQTDLTIFPKSMWNRMTDLVFLSFRAPSFYPVSSFIPGFFFTVPGQTNFGSFTIYGYQA